LFAAPVWIVLILQLAFEGYRAAVLPVYVLAAFMPVLNIFPQKSSLTGKYSLWLRRTGKGIVFTIALIVLAIPIVFHVPVLPEPSGEYQVGHRVYHWVDKSRMETLTKRVHMAVMLTSRYGTACWILLCQEAGGTVKG